MKLKTIDDLRIYYSKGREVKGELLGDGWSARAFFIESPEPYCVIVVPGVAPGGMFEEDLLEPKGPDGSRSERK